MDYYSTLIMAFVLAFSFSPVAMGGGEFANLVKIDIAKNEIVTNDTTSVASVETSALPVTTASMLPSTVVTTTTAVASTTSKVVTSSQKPTSTTPKATTTKMPPKTVVFEKPPSKKRTGLTNYFCKCDLTINSCDVNCCCDIDCAAEMVTSFSCAEETFDSNDYVMGNGLLPCNIQGGLFCVARDRADEALSTKIFDDTLKNNIKYKWPDIFPTTENGAAPIKEQYKLDDLILVYNEESKQTEQFVLPTRLAQHSSICRLKQPIQFLRYFETSCPVSVENLDDINLNFFEKVANTKFLRIPQLENIDSDDYVNATVQTCRWRISPTTCSLLNQTTDDWPLILSTGYAISIRLEHNFTQVTNVTLSLVYDLNLDFEQQPTVLQKFTVKFVQVTNQTDVYPISGNLGYLMHKPVLVTKLILDANDTIISSRLEFFEPTNRTNLKIPRSRRGYCRLDHNEFDTVKFGENVFLRCNAPLLQNNTTNNCITPESNLNEVCQAFQTQLFHFLLNNFEPTKNKTDMSEFNLLLSELGNPKNDTRHWHPIRHRNDWLESIYQIKGTSNNDIALVCHNMMLNVKYDFYYAQLAVGSVKHQNLIKKTELEYGPLVNLQFRFDEEFKVPIFIQIQFHDLTSMGSKVAVKFLVLSCAIIFNFLNF